MNIITEKSEILFLYETKYNIPNGDPFTGEPRYDEETKKALVSDVRIKRYIRDNMHTNGHKIYVINPDLDNKMTSGKRFKTLYDGRTDKSLTKRDFAFTLADVRMFGGVMAMQKDKKVKTKKTADEKQGELQSEAEERVDAFNVTGAIQFSILNPSLNSVNMMMNQRTSVLVSKEGNEQGSFATRYVIPYTIMQAHGWINPFNAKITKLTQDDVSLMFRSLWNEINSKNTTSKTDQSSLLILQIIYSNPNDKIYGADRFIKIQSDKQDEQLRSLDDFKFDWEGLRLAIDSPKIKALRYYTEIASIESELKNIVSDKLQKMVL